MQCVEPGVQGADRLVQVSGACTKVKAGSDADEMMRMVTGLKVK